MNLSCHKGNILPDNFVVRGEADKFGKLDIKIKDAGMIAYLFLNIISSYFNALFTSPFQQF